MAQSAAERKKAERDKKKEQGMKAKEVWFLPETLKIIEDFRKNNGFLTFEDAVNEIIKGSK
ncbi:hypothetical protein ACOUVU_05285 [Acinetobacter baumannii]|uniref:hypothetical protein n=1 Tax=Acinetobacter baumannii TaxID=470 RepID=UPI0002AEB00D|nr:hypothetical protein [Acinetobacter baumannii]ELX05909.1 hypothetical protein ACINNAV57_2591 [Acinetobacter baumannii Naval-57]TPT19379.1 hypothetical protein FJU71_06110 [Acinetobacter baumannii]